MAGIMSINMPGFFKAINYLSPLRYSIRNLAPYSLSGITFTCDASQRLPDGNCTIQTGKQVLQLYKLDENPLVNLLCLGACTIIYRFLAYALLKSVRMHWGEWRNKTRRAFRCEKKVEGSIDSTVEGSVAVQ